MNIEVDVTIWIMGFNMPVKVQEGVLNNMAPLPNTLICKNRQKKLDSLL